MDNEEQHKQCTNRFIELANELKDEDIDTTIVSGALMTASGIYATYIAAGNSGALESSGVGKVVELYRRTLEHYQAIKRQELEASSSTH